MVDLDWLAGFIEAEGCFQINLRNRGTSYGCELAIQLRDDDRRLLAELASEPIDRKAAGRPSARHF